MLALSCAGCLAAGIGDKYIKKYADMHLSLTYRCFSHQFSRNLGVYAKLSLLDCSWKNIL